jgi:hypothetical protein
VNFQKKKAWRVVIAPNAYIFSFSLLQTNHGEALLHNKLSDVHHASLHVFRQTLVLLDKDGHIVTLIIEWVGSSSLCCSESKTQDWTYVAIPRPVPESRAAKEASTGYAAGAD